MKKIRILFAFATLVALLPSCKKDEVPTPEPALTPAVDVENIHSAFDVLARANVTPVAAVLSADTIRMLDMSVEAIGVNITNQMVTHTGTLLGAKDQPIGHTYVFQIDSANAVVVDRLFDGT